MVSASEHNTKTDFLNRRIKELENPWINVADRLPEDDSVVLITDGSGWYDFGGSEEWDSIITHWMLIPPLKINTGE